jgi:hypothetical protein
MDGHSFLFLRFRPIRRPRCEVSGTPVAQTSPWRGADCEENIVDSVRRRALAPQRSAFLDRVLVAPCLRSGKDAALAQLPDAAEGALPRRRGGRWSQALQSEPRVVVQLRCCCFVDFPLSPTTPPPPLCYPIPPPTHPIHSFAPSTDSDRHARRFSRRRSRLYFLHRLRRCPTACERQVLPSGQHW